MKLNKFIVVFFTLLLLCVGCAKAPKAPEAPAESCAQLYDRLLQTNALPDMEQLEPELAYDFFGIAPESCADAVFYISADSMLADEALIVYANDDSADEIERLLNARLQAKADEAEGYSPEQFAIIKKCAVLRDKNRLALIVSPEFEKLSALFGGK